MCCDELAAEAYLWEYAPRKAHRFTRSRSAAAKGPFGCTAGCGPDITGNCVYPMMPRHAVATGKGRPSPTGAGIA